MGRTATRKKPCRICRRWFLPDMRLKERQKTCGRAECKRLWHNKKCAQWYRTNIDYFKADYLQKRIDAAQSSEPRSASNPKPHKPKEIRSRMKSGLPVAYGQELVGVKHIVIIEYLAQQLHKHRWRAPP